MKVNAINNTQNVNTYKNVSFKHTAVPYPEFESAYNKPADSSDFMLAFAEKISKFFSPEVRKEADNIKNTIDYVYDNDKNQQPKKALLTVLA